MKDMKDYMSVSVGKENGEVVVQVNGKKYVREEEIDSRIDRLGVFFNGKGSNTLIGVGGGVIGRLKNIRKDYVSLIIFETYSSESYTNFILIEDLIGEYVIITDQDEPFLKVNYQNI